MPRLGLCKLCTLSEVMLSATDHGSKSRTDTVIQKLGEVAGLHRRHDRHRRAGVPGRFSFWQTLCDDAPLLVQAGCLSRQAHGVVNVEIRLGDKAPRFAAAI